MPALRVLSVPDPERLLERAVDGVFPREPPSKDRPWPTLRAWIVLRQGGLRDDLHRLAAARSVPGWFGDPVCLFSELYARWTGETGDPRPPLTEPERLALLSTLMDDAHAATAVLRRAGVDAWVPRVDRLIGELVAEGTSADAWRGALERIAARDGDAFVRERADALAHVYGAWLRALESEARRDGRDALVSLARSIRDDADGFARALGGRRDVRIVGLSDLRGGWKPLLRALAATPALDALTVLTGDGRHIADALHDITTHDEDGARSHAAPTPALLEAPDAAREAELVAVRVRALIDAGVTPSRIAVIARDARPYVDTVAHALNRIGVPATARRRTTLAHTAPARVLRTLLALATDSWSRHSVVELAEHPLLATGLDADLVNLVGYSRPIASRAEWRAAYAELLERCERAQAEDEEGDSQRRALPDAARVRAALAAWDALETRVAPVDEPRSVQAWFAWCADTLTDSDWGVARALATDCGDDAVRRTDLRASELIVEHARAWARALEAFAPRGAPVDAARFAERLRVLLDQDLVTLAETDFGVVVAEALAAGWRAFDHVFVVGLSAGSFPARPAMDALLDRAARHALIAEGIALDEPDAWRTRERALFNILRAAPRESLTLSWPAMDADGREVARSAFADEVVTECARELGGRDENHDAALERLGVLVRASPANALTPGYPVVASQQVLDAAQRAAARELARVQDAHATPYNGHVEDAALRAWLAERYDERHTWSATQLEQMAVCRWQWFAARVLRLDERADAGDAMEPTVRGELQHNALARFFGAARARDPQRPVYLRTADIAWARPLLAESLRAAWDRAVAAGVWLGPTVMHDATGAELQRELDRYLDFEIDWNEKSFSKRNTSASKEVRTGAAEEEVEFGPVTLAGDGVSFRLRGRIDRIDHGVSDDGRDTGEHYAAIDYKSSKSSTPAAGKKTGWDDRVILQLPLYAAALRALRPERELARIEYRTLRHPESVHRLSFASVTKTGVTREGDSEEKLGAALDAAGALVRAARTGTLPAAPTESCGCPPYCVARDICRIPGGPVTNEW